MGWRLVPAALVAAVVALAASWLVGATPPQPAPPNDRPVVVVLVLHWGGFSGGTPSLMRAHVDALRQPGVAVEAPAYPLNDPGAATHALARRARRWRRSGHHVLAYGSSAGGTLALRLRELGAVEGAVAVAPLIDVARSFTPTPLLPVVPWSQASAVEVSPNRHACGPTATRTLILHARDDAVAPFGPSRAFARRCGVKFRASASGGHFVVLPRAAATGYVRRLVHALRRDDERSRARFGVPRLPAAGLDRLCSFAPPIVLSGSTGPAPRSGARRAERSGCRRRWRPRPL